jgi:hypothetical protein
VLLDKAVGNRAKDSSNHLLMQYPCKDGHEAFFVSRYALARLLHRTKGESDVRLAYDLAKRHHNPAFLGWVVEFDFIEQLSECAMPHNKKTMKLHGACDGVNFCWNIQSVTSFDPESPFTEIWSPDQYKRPLKWNQGGYDAVGLVRIGKKIVLRFLQVIRGHTHTIKLRFFSQLALKFADASELLPAGGSASADSCLPPCIHGVEIAVIIPRFQGEEDSWRPVVNIENSGQLGLFNIGNSESKWKYQHEVDSIQFVCFDADAGSGGHGGKARIVQRRSAPFKARRRGTRGRSSSLRRSS